MAFSRLGFLNTNVKGTLARFGMSIFTVLVSHGSELQNVTLSDDMQKMFTPSQWAETVKKNVWNFFFFFFISNQFISSLTFLSPLWHCCLWLVYTSNRPGFLQPLHTCQYKVSSYVAVNHKKSMFRHLSMCFTLFYSRSSS